MARYTGPKTKISRKFDEFIMGNPNVFKKKKYPPGQHGQKRHKRSEYALQLREKQKVRVIYGVLEKQFRKILKEATRRDGKTGDILLQLLDRRLDNVVFRLGMAPTRESARQLVSHKHIQINGKKVNIPSYLVKPGQVIGLTKKAKENQSIVGRLNPIKDQYNWLVWDADKLAGTFVSVPKRADIPEKIDEKSIIEFYSRS